MSEKLIFLRLIVVRICSFVSTISSIVSYTNTFVLCSIYIYDIPRICLYDYVSKAIILLFRFSVNVHVSHTYSIIESTSDLYRSIFVLMEFLLLFHIVFNLTNADVAVVILIFISDSLLPFPVSCHSWIFYSLGSST